MSRYPALHAARSEYRPRRLTATGLPVLAVLSWVVAGLLHQPPPPAPPRGDVANLEDARSRPDSPEEIAQSAARPPRSPAPSPRGASEARTPARTVGPRWTPAATSRPVPSAGPAPARTTPSPSPLRSGEAPEKGARTEKASRTPRSSTGGTARPRGSTVPATTRPTGEAARTPVPDSATRTAGPASARARSASSRTPAATTAGRSPSAPPSTERRTSFTFWPGPEPGSALAPPDLRECRGLLLPLLGCPAWAKGLWLR